MVVRVGRVSDGSRVDCRTVVVSVRVSLGGMPRHDTSHWLGAERAAHIVVRKLECTSESPLWKKIAECCRDAAHIVVLNCLKA